MSELKTQEEIQQEVRNLEAQLEHYKQVDPQNVDKHNELANQISELNFSLAQMQEREQKQLVTIGAATSVDILSQMFDALLPESKYKAVLGINEYDSKSQDFKQMIQAYISETVAKVYEDHDQEIVQKDDKIRQLNKQVQDVQTQLDEANQISQINSETLVNNNAMYEDLQTAYDELKTESDARNELSATENKRLMYENGMIREQMAELNTKLEAAQKPKESKPSESLQNMLSTIKSKNELNADDMVARWNSRQKSDESKIQVPDLPSAVLPFQGEDGTNPATDVGNTQLPSAQVDETVGPQFPSAPNVETVHAPDLATGNVPGESTHEQVAAKTEAERIAELERRVEALEGKVA